jgi:hypothetical protein
MVSDSLKNNFHISPQPDFSRALRIDLLCLFSVRVVTGLLISTPGRGSWILNDRQN